MNLLCTKCKKTKDSSEFHVWNSHKRGFRYSCKECRKGEDSEKKRSHYYNNKKLYNDRSKKWRKENKDRWNEYCKQYRKSDKFSYKTPLSRFHRAKRRAIQLKSTPEWSDQSRIKKIFELCHALNKEFNSNFEVDHIHPIQGDNFSGLHVWFNLMVIPRSFNRSKGNKLLKNTRLPRVSDNFDDYLSELKMYAELALKKEAQELQDKKLVG